MQINKDPQKAKTPKPVCLVGEKQLQLQHLRAILYSNKVNDSFHALHK